MENDKKFELDENTLDAVTGGASDEVFLDEENMPLGWYVTCVRCTLGFQVSEGECPSCGSKEVWYGTSKATAVYHPRSWR